VEFLRPTDEPDARHAETPLVERGSRGGDDLGVVGEAEVVVGAEVERLAGGRADVRGLRGEQLALVLVEARVADLGEGGGDRAVEVGHRIS